jgi:hypothetical protein
LTENPRSAGRLGLSSRTVRNHVQRILYKLQVPVEAPSRGDQGPRRHPAMVHDRSAARYEQLSSVMRPELDGGPSSPRPVREMRRRRQLLPVFHTALTEM